ALERLDTVSQTPKPTVDLLLSIARGYAVARELAKSEEVLKRAIELDPSRLQGYSLLGQLYAQQKRLDDARTQFEGLLKHDPTSVPARTMVGMIQEAQGKVAEAQKSYQSVLTVNPRAAVAANNLAWLYVSTNQSLEDALKLAQVAFEQLGDEPNVA